jgi:hypothetical protein
VHGYNHPDSHGDPGRGGGSRGSSRGTSWGGGGFDNRDFPPAHNPQHQHQHQPLLHSRASGGESYASSDRRQVGGSHGLKGTLRRGHGGLSSGPSGNNWGGSGGGLSDASAGSDASFGPDARGRTAPGGFRNAR